MPSLTRPHRYSPPTAATLHRTSANHKITKMQPDRHPSRAALKASPPQQYPRQADVYRPNYNTVRSYHHSRDYGIHGQRAQEGYVQTEAYGGAGSYDGGEPGRQSWATEPQSGRRGGNDYGNERQYGRYASHEVQSQAPQQRQYYQQTQQLTANERQYWDRTGYYQGVHSTTSSWQKYWPVYQQYYNPAAYSGQQASYPLAQPATSYRQEVYVPDPGYSHQQPFQHVFQQHPYLTLDRATANNLNGNASIFQPQAANRVPPTPINFIPGTITQHNARFMSASPSKQDRHPHLHILKRPSPTQEYLTKASEPVRTLETPRQLLIVLDLNGTLLFRKPKGGSTFVARPKVNEFIHYLLRNHRVMVWSSAKPENVKPMCKKLFDEEQHQHLAAVWARDTLRIPSHAYSSKVQVYKQLSWIWKDQGVQAANLAGAREWDQSNTVLIDDSVDKAASEPHSLVCIEEFQDRADQRTSDVLGQVVKYLETLKYEKDVSAFMRVLPFAYNPGEVFDWKV